MLLQFWLRLRKQARTWLVQAALDRSALAFFWAFLCLSVLYRLRLGLMLLKLTVLPFASQEVNVAWLSVQSFAGDILFAAQISLVYLWVKRYLRRRLKRNPNETRRRIRGAELAVADLALFMLALSTFSHMHLIFALETGLTASLFYVFATQFAVADFVRMISPVDFLAIFTPVLVFHLACRGQARLHRFLKPLLLVAGILFGISFLPWANPTAQELVEPPVAYFARDWLREPIRAYSGKKDAFKQRKDMPGEAQSKSIRLIDPAFVNERAVPAALADWQPPTGAETNRWNVMFFVMESVGSQYMFDTSAGNAVPMPFMKRIAEGGLHLQHHWSTANASPQCFFSIFTGLYPKPAHEIFSLRQDASTPMINRYLGPEYHTFMVHPSSPAYYFPRYLIANNGFTNLQDLSNLPVGPRPDKNVLARNEINSMEHALQLLDETPEPFLGIYWSFVAHHPYDDYGEEYRIRPVEAGKRGQYYNNLRTLDEMLKRMYEQLEKSGRLQRTILVFVGDHGEAFGQHTGLWGHGFGTFEETFHPPAIFYQPRLIPARGITKQTIHADILPTLLDFMGHHEDEGKFQGESLLRPSWRKYIFTMDGSSEYLTAIDPRFNKVSIAYELGYSFAYNLEHDPGEKFLLETDHFKPHLEAIVKFRNFQERMMEDYNKSIRAGKAYEGISLQDGPLARQEKK